MSNLTIRILTAIVGIPIVVLLSFLGGLFFLLLVMLCSSIALHEFYKLSEAKGAKPQIILGLIAGGLVNLSFYHSKLQNFCVNIFQKAGLSIPFPSQANLFFILIISILVVLLIIELYRNSSSPLLNLSSTILGLIYAQQNPNTNTVDQVYIASTLNECGVDIDLQALTGRQFLTIRFCNDDSFSPIANITENWEIMLQFELYNP